MTSRKRQQNMENRNTDYAAQSPKELNDESVDDMLENVDQFIQGVYRDLSISPPRRNCFENYTSRRRSLYHESSISSINSSPDGATSLPNASFANERSPVVSPTTRRNMDAEIERINQICDNVDQNLRSIGVYMNNSSDRSTSEDILNSNLTSSPATASTSYVLSHDSPPLSTIVRNYNLQMGHQRRRSSPMGSVAAHVIDLSESQTQTPVVSRQHVHQNNLNVDDDDDDVILVSADIHPVVDLCTPGGHQEEYNPRTSVNLRQLNRRRLTQQDEGDTCCQAGPTSTRKRRNEYFTPTEHSNKPSESSNVDTSPSAASGHTPFMCPVCMESCLQRQPTSTRCGHVFCKECIERAIRSTHKCPMCNSKISRTQIFRIYL